MPQLTPQQRANLNNLDTGSNSFNINQPQADVINSANNNIINASQLENPTPDLNLPTGQVDLGNIQSFFMPTAVDAELEKTRATQARQSDDLFGSLLTSLNTTATQGARTAQAEEAAGIPQLQTDLTDITNQINQTSLDFRRERERIQTEPGMTMASKNALLADVSRKQASQLADLEVIRQARSNTLTNVEGIVQRKLELQFADETARVNNLKFVYGQLKDDLTKTEDRQFQRALKREEAQLDFAKSKYETLENEKLTLVRNAQANGAGNQTLAAILQAKDIEGAYKAAGSYGVSLSDKIAMANYRAKLLEAGLSPNVVDSTTETIDQINVIDDALNNVGGLKAVAGSTAVFGRRGLFRKGKALDFAATVEQITSQLTLDQLISAKERGATFGALSEKELKSIASAATKLGSFIRERDNGDIYFKASESAVRKELEKIKSFAIKDYELKTGTSYQPINTEEDYLDMLETGYSPFSIFDN